MDVKQILKSILKAKNWTAYRLGIETGISGQVLSHWSRKGASSIKLTHLVALKEALGSWKALGELIEAQVDSDSD
jgi:transcriptional regulator with XRE-family HTH domain